MDREQTSTRSTDSLLTFRETHMTGLQPTQQYCTTSSLQHCATVLRSCNYCICIHSIKSVLAAVGQQGSPPLLKSVPQSPSSCSPSVLVGFCSEGFHCSCLTQDGGERFFIPMVTPHGISSFPVGQVSTVETQICHSWRPDLVLIFQAIFTLK